MYKFTFSLILLGLCTLCMRAQSSYQLTPDEQKAVTVLNAANFGKSSTDNLTYSEFAYFEDGDPDEFTAKLLSPFDNKTPDKHNRYSKYTFNRPAGKKIKNVTMNYGKCKSVGGEFTWKGDEITRVRVGHDSYDISYDDKGRVYKLDMGMTQMSGSGLFKERAYFLTYDDQGRLVKSEKRNTNFKGKSRDKLKPYFDYKDAEIIYTYGDNSVIVKSFSYRSKKKPKEDEKVTGSSKATFTQKGNVYRKDRIANSHLKSGIVEYLTEYINTYDEAGNLVKEIRIIKGTEHETTYTHDKDGNEITTLRKATDENGVVTSEYFIESDYDSKGMPITTKSSGKKNGKFDSRTVAVHKWEAARGSLGTCGKSDKGIKQTLNEQGKVVKESGPKGFRKKENGSWGPWKSYSM